MTFKYMTKWSLMISFILLTLSACSFGEAKKANTTPQVDKDAYTSPLQIQPIVHATPDLVTPTPKPTLPPEKVKEAENAYNQGFALYNEFKYDEAIKYFDEAIAADPNSYKAYNGKGIALCFKGNYNEGIPLIQKALELKPDFVYANFNMAMAYKLQKDYQNSLIWFKKAIALDSGDTWSYYGISTIYADWNDVPKALEYLKKAVELDNSVKEVAKQQDHFKRLRNNPEFAKLVN